MSPSLRSALGAGLGWAVVIGVAGALDASGLAAPLAWTGADPTAARWTMLQYALYGPLMVLLVAAATGALLRVAPGAPRRWVAWRVWLLVIGAVMLAKLGYSAVLLAPELGSGPGLPLGATAAYLVWATGITGVKALLLGWIPAAVAALLWRPAWTSPVQAQAARHGSALWLSISLFVALVAIGGRWLAMSWWTGSPVGYAYSSDWRSLTPTAATGWLGQIAALTVLALLFAHSLTATVRRTSTSPPERAPVIAGVVAALAAGLGLALVQTLVAVVSGTDLPGDGDLWVVPSTYLRLIEGLSFGLLVVPVAAVAVWVGAHLDRRRPARTVRAAGVAVALAAVTISSDPGLTVPPAATDPQPVALPDSRSAGPRGTGETLAPPARLTVRRDADGAAVLADQRGAQVVLRGVNVNQLGEYYAANPEVPPIAPLTQRDFADIAAMGFDAVRLVLSWSRVAPRPGAVDEDYLGKVRRAVGWAGEHGIHVVLDMHQDAWGASVVAPEGTVCRAGTSPMTGWDGAPDWTSHVDGAPPCMFTGRDLAPNVLRAFSSFYADREQIQTQLVSAWGRIAETFGADPTVAGYDLLNEPSFAEQAPLTSGALLGRYHARAIDAIRAGEQRAADGYAHPVFLEPSIWWSGFGIDPLPPRGFTTDSQVVFAPHLYNESITMDQSLGVTLVGIQRGFALAQRAAARWGAPLWIGEWGSFRDSPTNRSYYERFMTQADAARVGTAIWVWKQACGDPRSYPSEQAGNIRRMACPEGTALPTRIEELAPVTRAYPRAVPGRLLAIESGERSLRVVGSLDGAGDVRGTPDSCALDIWVPGPAEPRWGTVSGVMDLRAVRVPEGSKAQDPSGGWRVIGCVSDAYELTVETGSE